MSRRIAIRIVLCLAALAALIGGYQWLRPQSKAHTTLLQRVLALHLRQHAIDAPLAQRMLQEFVLQLDPDKVFFLDDEARQIAALNDAELQTLSAQIARNDSSYFAQIIQHFLDTQLARDRDFYAQLESHAKEIVARASSPVSHAEKLTGEDARATTDAARRQRVLDKVASRYAALTPYLDEPAALKTAADLARRDYARWRDANPAKVVPALFLKSFMQALDPHSEYLDSDETAGLSHRLAHDFGGIGAKFKPSLLGGEVLSLTPGGPAEQSGQFARGDQVVAIDGTELHGEPLGKVLTLMDGPLGSEVHVTLIKAVSRTRVTVTLRRAKTNASYARILGHVIDTPGGAVAVIYISSFYRGMMGDLATRLDQMRKKRPFAALVLDLRGNAGGLVDEAVAAAGLFIGSGPVVGEIGPLSPDPSPRWGEGLGRGAVWHEAHDAAPAYSGPLVILTDQFTASAAETLAGALQDYGRAVVVGPTQTFGKGTEQSLVPLIAHGELKVTDRQFFRPSGSSVQLKGVEPDIVIPGLPLDEAALERALRNPIPWSSVESHIDSTRADVKAWTAWKTAHLSELRAKSQARAAGIAPGDKEAQAGEAAGIAGDMAASWR